ncbi:hypothetical protein LTR67_006508 [Exophiala xenobiotica]
MTTADNDHAELCKRPNIEDKAGILHLRSKPSLPHLISSMSQVSGLIELIYQTVPGVAALRQEKPKLNWRILLQETEVMGNAKRWTVVAKGDKSEYGSWYARNVRDGTAKTVKIEVHILAGEAEEGAIAEEQGDFLEELQEMSNGKTRHASRLTSLYRQLKVEVQGQTTMRGVPNVGVSPLRGCPS